MLPALEDVVTGEALAGLAAVGGEDAAAFIGAAYAHGWVRSYDGVSWKSTPEGEALVSNEATLAGATPAQLVRLVTAIVRADRFSEGLVEAMARRGLLARIVARAAALAADAGAYRPSPTEA